jgi:hypothetical protein
MKINIVNTEYRFTMDSEAQATESREKSCWSARPFLYNVNIKISSNQELGEYPKEILARIVTKFVKKGMEKYNE